MKDKIRQLHEKQLTVFHSYTHQLTAEKDL